MPRENEESVCTFFPPDTVKGQPTIDTPTILRRDEMRISCAIPGNVDAVGARTEEILQADLIFSARDECGTSWCEGYGIESGGIYAAVSALCEMKSGEYGPLSTWRSGAWPEGGRGITLGLSKSGVTCSKEVMAIGLFWLMA